MRIMFRISLVAALRCLSHLKYFGGTAGTPMYAARSLQKTIVRCDAAARKSPLKVHKKYFEAISQY